MGLEVHSVDAVFRSNLALGLSLSVALLGLGLGALIWVRHIMPDAEVVEERHDMRSSDAERASFAEYFSEATGASQFVKRPLVRRTLMLATLPLVAAPVVLLRDLGPLPGTSLRHTVWSPGRRLLVYGTNTPITPAEFSAPGGMITIVPDGPYENPSYTFLIGRAYYETGQIDLAQPFIEEAVKKEGGEIVEDLSYTEKSDKDFTSQLTKIRDANPQAIFVPGYYTEAGLIARQARGLGIRVPLIGGDGWDSDQTLKAGDAVNGCYFSNHYAPDEKRPQVQAFVSAYQAKYKKVPDAMAVLGYDAMKLLAHAINQAGSTDGQKVRDALAQTRDFPGVAGAITMDADRNARKPIVIIKIQDGQFKYVTSMQPPK